MQKERYIFFKSSDLIYCLPIAIIGSFIKFKEMEHQIPNTTNPLLIGIIKDRENVISVFKFDSGQKVDRSKILLTLKDKNIALIIDDVLFQKDIPNDIKSHPNNLLINKNLKIKSVVRIKHNESEVLSYEPTLESFSSQ